MQRGNWKWYKIWNTKCRNLWFPMKSKWGIWKNGQIIWKKGCHTWREISKTDGRRIGNREKEAGNSEEEIWDGRIKTCKNVKEEIKNVKLPKLNIAKFEVKQIDLVPFWNEYEFEIDKSELRLVSKFNYLKELLAPKLRLPIDTLPFTSEGYSRVIAMLKAKFGKPFEVSATLIQCITSLPVIINSNPSWYTNFMRNYWLVCRPSRPWTI